MSISLTTCELCLGRQYSDAFDDPKFPQRCRWCRSWIQNRDAGIEMAVDVIAQNRISNRFANVRELFTNVSTRIGAVGGAVAVLLALWGHWWGPEAKGAMSDRWAATFFGPLAGALAGGIVCRVAMYLTVSIAGGVPYWFYAAATRAETVQWVRQEILRRH